jgi:hypothetical protein
MKMMMKLWNLLLAAALALTACPAPNVYDDGEDTQDLGYIEIKSAADFAKIGKEEGYPLDGEYQIPAGKNLRLSDWTPIGTEAAPFTGKLSGNNGAGSVAIESFSPEALGGKYLGLFGVTEGAEIADLTVTLNVVNLGLNTLEDHYAAGLAGRVTGGKIKNVTAAGALRITKSGSRSLSLAGVAALVRSASIEGCASAVTLAGTFEGSGYAGGIAAQAEGRTVISASSALGDLTLSSPPSWSEAYAGGIVGYSESSGAAVGTALKLSGVNYTEGTVSAEGYSAFSGGVAGYVRAAEIDESFSSGTVSARGSTPFAGGVVAFLGGGTARNLYSAAAVHAVSVTRRALAGGIAGGVSEGGEISAAYVTARVCAEGTGSKPGLTNAAPDAALAGGIAGALYNGASTVRGSAVLEGSEASAADLVAGAAADPRAYRIAAKGTAAADAAVLASNIAWEGMALESARPEGDADKGEAGQDGKDCPGKPAQSDFAALGWDFSQAGAWKMGRGGFPALAGQPVNIGDYITIAGASDLAQIGKNNAYPLSADYRIAEGAADISLSDWVPIGTAEQPFTGTMTGNGTAAITINSFDAAAFNGPSLGLFGVVKGSTQKWALLKDLKVTVNMAATAALNAGNKAQYVAALAGYGEEITIENAVVSGTIKVNKSSGYPLYSGGVAGYLKNGKMSGSASSVAVESEGQSGVYSGGILGYAAGSFLLSGSTSTGVVTVKAGTHNSSAGGIVGYILGTNDSTVSRCTASGDVSLTTAAGREASLLMFYCGGVVGYAGNGTADMGDTERTGAVIEQCGYLSGTVYCENAYPYAGGVIGYNYTGSEVHQSFSAAAAEVKAKGSRLPYAGGVAGYISGAAKVENSYSHATVLAEAPESRQALAGGVAGATAKPSLLSKCYATGTVTAKINGAGTADMGGSLGVRSGANAGGISGSLYFASPKVERSAALNASVSGIDTASGGTLYVYRIGGLSDLDGSPVVENNIAWSTMPVIGGSVSAKGANNEDGADCTAKPAQSVYSATLGWDFAGVWKMGNDGYPALRWE